MKKKSMGLLAALVVGASLVPAPATATVGGYLDVDPGTATPTSATATDFEGAEFVTFNTNLNAFGGNLDVTANFGSYGTALVVVCTGAGGGIDSKTGTNTTNGDILLLCDFVNGSFGYWAQYLADT